MDYKWAYEKTKKVVDDYFDGTHIDSHYCMNLIRTILRSRGEEEKMDYKKVYEKIEEAVNNYEDGEYNTDADGYMEAIGKIIRAQKEEYAAICGGEVEKVVVCRTDFSDKTDGQGLTCFECILKQLGVGTEYWDIADSITLKIASYKIFNPKSKSHH